MSSNLDGTEGLNTQTRNHPRHGTQCDMTCDTCDMNPAHFVQDNDNGIWASLVQLETSNLTSTNF